MGSNRWAVFGIVLALSGSAAACGGDEKKSAEADASTFVGQSKTLTLAAGEAGNLSVGAAKIDVPAGALSTDLALTVDVKSKSGMPHADDIAVDIYDFGPNGTKFEKPVTLSFDMGGVTVDDKHDVKVAFLEGDTWNPLTTTVKDGKASADTTHFTPFTLIFVLKSDGAEQVGGQCGDDFKGCGGDIAGVWEYTGACLTAPDNALGGTGGDDPFADCDDKPVAALTVDLTGTVTFGADGSFEAMQTIALMGGYRVSSACLAQAGGGVGLTCAQVGGTEDGDACVISGEDKAPKQEDATGTYSTSGNAITFVDDNETPDAKPDANAYCVKGDTLQVRTVDGDDGTIVVYSATRK